MSHARTSLFLVAFCVCLVCGCSSNRAFVEPLPTTRQFLQAEEFKLKVREIADQLLATVPNECLTGLTALPTSFVNLDNFQQSSSFGRLVGESLIYEFNQRSFPVREYRLPGYIAMRAEQGDFALARQGLVNAQEKWAALLIGTYYRDKEAIFVNARLVRAADGMVLRTAQLVLVNTQLVERLSQPTPTPTQIAMANAVAAQEAQAAQTAAFIGTPKSIISTGSLTIQQAPVKRAPRKARNPGPGLWGQGVQQ